jgi:hypothetical protein
MVMTADELGEAFEELGTLAREAGKVIDIAVYGGSCLMIASNFRVSTADVDAVAVSDQAFLDEAAKRVAEHRGWARDWLSDGVRTYLSPNANWPAHHELLRAYPEARISGRLALALDELWRARDKWRRGKRGHEAPRYLGRSGPAR